MTDANNSPAREIVHLHVTHPDRDDIFRATATPSDLIKRHAKTFGVQCTQCQKVLDKLLKCSKCKGVWYCSKECQKEHWPTHKSACHAVECSSGALKFVRMFCGNITLMMYLKVAIIYDCGLLDNPRLGFDIPFMARVDIAIEPTEILDFAALYLNNRTVAEKLKGMVQVNTISAWDPNTHPPLTEMRLGLWRKARAESIAAGFGKDPVGLIEFLNYTENSSTAAFHISSSILDTARKREPFLCSSAVTGKQFEKPMDSATCIECLNLHIRADGQNQLLLRTVMTEQDKEVIRAAGRNEDSLSVSLLNYKMQRELLYANIIKLKR
ncbi:hypothetical protein DEU56DRAFT_913672 [Suillus clintonianus]|uniref:uncharacterized protein n=1 Tax=Suillus clintonianus TaxID=1904413 RepID=UPI001B868994|nr:uncharacterized protein DEU56DRAFT_913672 [Suillus clintonianus]KAG2134485.1 hypothetical protein DEU56DRAFT_913672 [Suillus clintonianus]